jgi:hypothetical protein
MLQPQRLLKLRFNLLVLLYSSLSMSSSRQNPTTAPRPGTYTVLEGIMLARTASTRNRVELAAAADYMIQVFQANSIPTALMGGFSLLIRGSSRMTHDVDLVAGCNMQQLVAVLSQQPR